MEYQVPPESRPTVYLISPTTLLHEYVDSATQALNYSLRKFVSIENFCSEYDALIPGCVLYCATEYDRKASEFLDTIRSIKKTAQVILSACDWNIGDVVLAIQAGFTDFFDLTTDCDKLSIILTNAIERDRILFEAKSFEIPPSVLEKLNPEETRILQLIVQGRTTKQMSVELDLSVRTLHYRKNSIFAKLGVRDRSEASEIIRNIRHDNHFCFRGPPMTESCQNSTV